MEEKNVQRLPSGKIYNPLDRPVPGQSLTKPFGQYPWEQPPTETNPTVALAIMLDKFEEGDNLARILAVLQEGVTVKQLSQGLLLTGFATGLFNATVAELIREDLETYIQIIAKKAGIDYKLGKTRKDVNAFYRNLKNLKDEKKILNEKINSSKPQKINPQDSPIEDEEFIEPSEESLMAKPPSEGLMSKEGVE